MRLALVLFNHFYLVNSFKREIEVYLIQFYSQAL